MTNEMKALNNKIELIKKLQALPIGAKFVASDIEVSGATIHAFLVSSQQHSIQVVGQEKVWYEVDDETMKASYRNVYQKMNDITMTLGLQNEIAKLRCHIEDEQNLIEKTLKNLNKNIELLNVLENL